MKKKLEEKIKIPEGVSCTYNGGKLICSKGADKTERKIKIPEVEIKISDGELIFLCEKGNKNHYKKIMSNMAHVRNMFKGLGKKFTYTLEICHVHFPMSVKVEGNKLTIANFFGEKNPRRAEILSNVEVEISGAKILVSSPNKDAAGQTAANFERATRLTGRDRRIFQDGIYIVSKPGGENA